MKTQLLEKIRTRQARLGVVGLGYVGLPLAVEFAQAGIEVVGIDVDARKVAAITRGESYIPDVPSATVAALAQAGRLSATTDYAALRDCDAVSICVPTPLNKTRDPDMSYVIDAANQVAAHAHPGFLIVLESTTYPGTTEEILLPKLNEAGWRVGEDVFLAFSPERIDPGNAHYGVRNTPKVLGGATPACTETAQALYAVAVETIVPVSTMRAAEMVKLLENTFRAVNIGLVNEMALMCAKLGVDVWEVIEAASTKPYGFMKFTPGPGLGGHCLAGDEYAFLRNAAGLHTLTLRTLVEQLSQDGTRRIVEQGGQEAYAPQGWDVLSYDPQAHTSCWQPLQFVSRRAYAGPMVHIRTRDGRRLTTTDGHPMIVHREDAFHTCRADELEPGDALVVPLGQPEAAIPAIDLIAHLDEGEVARMRAKPSAGRYADHDRALRPRLLALGLSPRDVFEDNAMPLAVYLALETEGAMPVPRRQVRLATGKGSSYNSFPAVIELDDGFARLIGYYLSEGCISVDPALRVRFTFHVDEVEFLADLRAQLDRLGVRFSERRDRRWQSYHVKVSSRPLAILLRDVLGCGTNCYNMQIPGRLLEAAEPVRRALLAGLLRGDGDVYLTQGMHRYRKNGKSYAHRMNACTAGYYTSSPVLFQQVIRLLQGLAFVPTFKRDMPRLRLYGAAALERLEPIFAGAKRERLQTYRERRSKPMPTTQSQRHDGFATVAVRSIEHAEPVDAVYSLEVEGTHTFVTSYGLLAHNCLPIDPLYLSWKLKSLNYTARFIELADAINSRMPEHVAGLVSDALNEAGRAMNGARVLVLGVAYKKDIDDVRESPGLDVMAELAARRAAVSYHDPHVAQVLVGEQRYASQPLTAAALAAADCVVITTDHTAFDWDLIRAHARLVVDTRNALRGAAADGARLVRL